MSADKTTVHNMPSSIVDAQLQRLLEIVDDYQKKQCEALMEQARQQSRQIVRHSYHNARSRLKTHILEDRQQLADSMASTRAKRHTFAMQQKHQANRKFLDDSWGLLKVVLKERWENPQNRKLWIQSIVQVALQNLTATEWSIEHGKAWSAADKKLLTETVKVHSDTALKFHENTDIESGIRFSAGGASVDGTLQGLLSDRERIESEFLAQCAHCIVHDITSENGESETAK